MYYPIAQGTQYQLGRLESVKKAKKAGRTAQQRKIVGVGKVRIAPTEAYHNKQLTTIAETSLSGILSPVQLEVRQRLSEGQVEVLAKENLARINAAHRNAFRLSGREEEGVVVFKPVTRTEALKMAAQYPALKDWWTKPENKWIIATWGARQPYKKKGGVLVRDEYGRPVPSQNKQGQLLGPKLRLSSKILENTQQSVYQPRAIVSPSGEVVQARGYPYKNLPFFGVGEEGIPGLQANLAKTPLEYRGLVPASKQKSVNVAAALLDLEGA